MAQQQYPATALDLASLVRDSLYGFNARVAASAVTLPAPTPSARSWSAPLPAQDGQAIEEGHAQRREMLARRRAEQQVRALMSESQRLGVTLSTAQIADVAVTAYTDTLAVARR
jgi:hypothetical protein